MTAASRMRPRASVGWRGRIRSRVEQGGSERGAVLVEAALVFPIFLLLLFGLIEFGFIFKDTQTLDNMTRAGVRVGAIAGNSTDPDADYQILTSVLGASFGITPKEVIIFDATSLKGNAPGNVPNECTNGTFLCNIYTTTQLGIVQANLSQGYDAAMMTDFGPPPSGSGPCGLWDQTYCAGSQGVRDVSQSGNGGSGPSYIGVYISAVHTNLTGFFGPSVTLSDTAVMQLEPQTP
jgi:TadE-like protein